MACAGAATGEETSHSAGLFSPPAVAVLGGFNQKRASSSLSVCQEGAYTGWICSPSNCSPGGVCSPVLTVTGGLEGLPRQDTVDEAWQTLGLGPTRAVPQHRGTGARSPVSACLGDHGQGLKVR